MKESELPNEPVTYDDMLMDYDFHDVVNADQEMNDDINAVTIDTDDILDCAKTCVGSVVASENDCTGEPIWTCAGICI